MKESKFQFKTPYLAELNFVNSFWEDGEEKVEMNNFFSIDITDKKQNSAIVELTLEVKKENLQMPFVLKIKYASEFMWEEDMEDAVVDKMLRTNAPALLLSYMRPIIANLTNAAGYPAYNIPFMNFQK